MHHLSSLRFVPLLIAVIIATTGIADAQVYSPLGATLRQDATNELFGSGVALSADGLTLAVGVPNAESFDGEVRVFQWDSQTSAWVRKGLDLQGNATDGNFGTSVALSADGSTLAVGAIRARNAGTSFYRGEVKVFGWDGDSWGQLGPDLEYTSTNEEAFFGWSVSLSDDGTRLAASATRTGGGGYQGLVRVFDWSGSGWSQIDQENGTDVDGEFGYSIDLSGDGNRLAVGATREQKVRVYNITPSLVEAEIFSGGSSFGVSVSLSDDGKTLAAGARQARTVDVFRETAGSWSQLGSRISRGDSEFGIAVDLTSVGDHMVVGARRANSDAGKVWLYQLGATGEWEELQSFEPESGAEHFGGSVSISEDGKIFAASASRGAAAFVTVYKLGAYLSLSDDLAVEIESGGTYSFDPVLVGASDQTVFTLSEPSGQDPVEISPVTLSGTAMSDYSVESVPATVAAGGSETFTVSFSPSAPGLRTAQLEIVNDGAVSPYIVMLEGIGTLPEDFGDADGDGYFTSGVDAASHYVTGPYLGTEPPDDEADGQRIAATASGDDDDGIDDENGVTLPSEVFVTALGGTTAEVSLVVTDPDQGNVRVFAWVDLDIDGVFDHATESFGVLSGGVADDPVTTTDGISTITITMPAGLTPGTTYARFRVCTAFSICGSPSGLATDGEVEDYQVSLVNGDNLPIQSGASVDTDGTSVIITNPDGSTTTLPLASITELTLTGTPGPDSVTLSAALLQTPLTINVNLGDGFDDLVLAESVAAGDVHHIFESATSGRVEIAGGATIVYTGLDPILDVVTATTRTMTFSAVDDVITVSADGDGASGNGASFIDSNAAEEVSFVNPTSELTINTGDGANTVALGLLDLPLDAGFVGVTVNGGTDADHFTVTPAEYPITVNGGAPAAGLCLGDALTFDLSGGAVIDTITNVAGSGTVTFEPPHAPVTFTSIESIGDADIALAANYEVLYATQDLAGTNALVITATNDGPTDANCVTVTIDADLAAWLANETVVSSAGGTYTAPDTWTISTLAVGASETLTIEGFVAPNAPQDVVFTSSAAQDTNAANNAVAVELSIGFMMPAKTQVNAGLYYTKTVSGGVDYEALVAGIWGGAPGIDGAVWCKIPSEVTGIWPVAPMTPASVGNFWRPCANELPYPLHPTDLFEDPDTGRIWLTTWGNGGLYYSDDDGETWVQSNPDPSCVIVYTITKDAGGVLYISANDGLVFRSLDGGDSWQQVGSLPGVAADTPWSMTAHPTVAGTIYAGTFGGGVFISEDFGFTWAALNELGTENQDLIDAFGGHVFDLEFSPDADYLYAATGTGVWQADLTAGAADFTGAGWAFMGPTVTLDDASVVTPEIRTLAFSGDGAGGTTDVLVAGSWGFGAFNWADPNASAVFTPLVLREGNVTFVAVSPSGIIYLGTDTGEQTTIVLSASGVSTASEPVQQELPDGYVLSQNYPNPFNPMTTIGFALPETGRVRLAVYDGLGREVALLVDGTLEAGHHEARFDAMDLPTGAYLYRLTAANGAIARTLILMR